MADIKTRGFRVNDVVTIHNYIQAERAKCKGRVICTNRVTRYGQNIVTLVDLGDSETVECFCKDGTRYLQGTEMRMTLGWEGNDVVPKEG